MLKSHFTHVCADGGANHGRPGMALVVQVTQLERRLRDERLAADVKASQLEATIRRLEAQINAEKQRRQSEQLRAIVEGVSCKALLHKLTGHGLLDHHSLGGPEHSSAPDAGATFTMHKAADSTARHVWFSPSHNLLKWALARNVPGAKSPQSADNKERSTSVNHMASVVSGAHLFPSQENKGACCNTSNEGLVGPSQPRE